jgi:hypothetical protein
MSGALTPLKEMHMTEEDTLSKELLTEIEFQVGALALEEQGDPSFSKTLAGTLYSSGSLGSMEETEVSNQQFGEKNGILKTQTSNESLNHIPSKPSFLLNN